MSGTKHTSTEVLENTFFLLSNKDKGAKLVVHIPMLELIVCIRYNFAMHIIILSCFLRAVLIHMHYTTQEELHITDGNLITCAALLNSGNGLPLLYVTLISSSKVHP